MSNESKDKHTKHAQRNMISVCCDAPVYTIDDKHDEYYCYDCHNKLQPTKDIMVIAPERTIVMCFPDKKYDVHQTYIEIDDNDVDASIMRRRLLTAYWFDIRARIELKDKQEKEQFEVIHAGDRKLIPTGLKVSMPTFVALDIRPRSGLAYKAGITLVNSPGTVDFNYRNEVGAILLNTDKKNEFIVYDGDRIAQARFSFVYGMESQVSLVKSFSKSLFKYFDKIFPTTRGLGGFGSSGIK